MPSKRYIYFYSADVYFLNKKSVIHSGLYVTSDKIVGDVEFRQMIESLKIKYGSTEVVITTLNFLHEVEIEE